MKTIRIFLLLVCAALTTRAQDSLAVENIEKRLREVEIKTQMEELIDKRVELAEQSFQNQLNHSWIAYITTIVGAVLALGVSVVVLYNNARNFARQKVEEEISTIVRRERDLIQKAIDLQALEAELIRKSKIGVITTGERGDYPMSSYFSSLGFYPLPKPLYVNKDEQGTLVFPAASEIQSFDVVFIDNNKSRIEKESITEGSSTCPQIDAFIGQLPENIAIFYYGSARIAPARTEKRQLLLAIANLTAQVYPNLLNLLKMRQLLFPKP